MSKQHLTLRIPLDLLQSLEAKRPQGFNRSNWLIYCLGQQDEYLKGCASGKFRAKPRTALKQAHDNVAAFEDYRVEPCFD